MLNIPTSVLPVVLRNYFISKIAHWPHDSKIIVFLKTIWKLRVFPSLTVAFFSSAEEIVRTLIPSPLLPDPSTLINALIWINGEATCNGYSRRSYWRKWSSLEYCILGSGPCRTKMIILLLKKWYWKLWLRIYMCDRFILSVCTPPPLPKYLHPVSLKNSEAILLGQGKWIRIRKAWEVGPQSGSEM